MPPPTSHLTPTIHRGLFISDLHLFSPRSDAAHIPEQLAQINTADQCLVLGGDIFDFRWSIRGSHELSLVAAVHWLEELLTNTGDAHIRFLPGNHDCHPEFLARLAELAQREPRFDYREHHLQLGDTLFLHGDVLDARGNLATYRAKFHHEEPQTDVKHRLYDMAVSIRLHKLVPLLRHRPEVTSRRLRLLIEALRLAEPATFKRVFFGHTHAPIFGHQSQGIQYYNPGASLKHMRSFPQRFEFDNPVPIVARLSES